jgi:phosphoglycolate phosphatase-like HAD superfamily hydrolase
MPLDLARIHALCFDVDGTLRDTDDMLVQQLASLFKPLRFLFPDHNTQVYARRVVMSLDEPGNFVKGLTDTWHIDGPLAHLGDRLSKPCNQPKARPPLIVPGVREMLATLSRHYPLAIVSARGQRSTQIFLDCHELTPYFQIVVTGQTCEYTKPYPDPILWAAKQMNVPAEQCLMIGDTTVDIRAGRAAGSQTVGVLCGFGQEGELARAGADLILPTTALLTDYLLQ